ncbi:MAG: proteasome accessory factor PafA2 family protein, partial [Betaproteobacteria bacterium]|nr:proteasome accessory factor PafA2 family protein [Betaproteobacteria bacterium]
SKDVVARWTDVLDKLEEDPAQLSRELDWVIKKDLIEAFYTETGFDPKKL